jgi:SAM-dependent methyltransferase
MVTPEEAARRIFGERASYYTTSAAHTDPQVLARVVELAAPQPTWTALDIGTGTGHTAFALAPHLAAVVGLDLTPEMLAEAEQLRAARGLNNVTFQIADAHALPYPDASVDLVTCRRAAHHFSDIDRALAEMARVLRPGGRLVIDDRSAPEDDALDDCVNDLDWLHDESHVREYRPDRWVQLLTAAGLVVEVVEPYIRHRPLTSLTDDVAPANVARIHARLDGLDAAQRAALGVVEIDGQLWLNHYYVLLAACRRDPASLPREPRQ